MIFIGQDGLPVMQVSFSFSFEDAGRSTETNCDHFRPCRRTRGLRSLTVRIETGTSVRLLGKRGREVVCVLDVASRRASSLPIYSQSSLRVLCYQTIVFKLSADFQSPSFARRVATSAFESPRRRSTTVVFSFSTSPGYPGLLDLAGSLDFWRRLAKHRRGK